MGTTVVVDVRDDDVHESCAGRGLRLAAARRRDVQHVQGRAARSAGSTAASSRSRTRTRTCARCSLAASELRVETRGYFDAHARRRGRARPLGARQGVVGRPRRRAPRPAPARATTRSTPAATSSLRGGALPDAALADRHPAPDRCPTRSRRWSRRTISPSRRRAPTSAARTSVDPHTARPPERRALGDRHRPGARHGRRLRDRRVRDGGGRPRLDGSAPRLRGADDPRRRSRSLDARFPGRVPSCRGRKRKSAGAVAFVHLTDRPIRARRPFFDRSVGLRPTRVRARREPHCTTPRARRARARHTEKRARCGGNRQRRTVSERSAARTIASAVSSTCSASSPLARCGLPSRRAAASSSIPRPRVSRSPRLSTATSSSLPSRRRIASPPKAFASGRRSEPSVP